MKKITLIILVAFTVLTGCKKENTQETPDAKSESIKRYVRKNAQSPEAAKDLEAFAKAIAIMKQKGCDDPTSWYYQGAIHWIPDEISGQNKLCSDYQNYSQLKEGWDNCTHTEEGTEEIHFLVWHRMYIYHLEKIIRKTSGYEDFALPYWAYTNTQDSLNARVMPAPFRDPNLSLYQSARLDSLQNGFPISGKTTRRLSLTKLNEYNTYALYNQNIDKAPHGAMHNYIGFGNDTLNKQKYNEVWQQNTYGMMSEVATAAFDPIFWMHHSNIDRIWQQWTTGSRYCLKNFKKYPGNMFSLMKMGKKYTTP